MAISRSSFDGVPPALAPWWHSLLVLGVLAIASVAGAIGHGLPNVHLPGLETRLSSYITVLVEEWLLALLVWLALRRQRVGVGALVSGSWHSASLFTRDLGIALGAGLLIAIFTNLLMYLIGGAPVLNDILPRTPVELGVWLVLAASAGFCEELTFRGYLTLQFGAWTGSPLLGIVLQGVVFGLAHGFYHLGMVVIMVHGCLLGALAQWRRSLRPGMLAHGLQDGLGGIVGFFTR